MNAQIFKYIVTEQGAIIFPESVTHSQAVNRNDIKVMSAGFCKVTFKCNALPVVECYGESASLGIRSIPMMDSMMVKRIFNPLAKYEYIYTYMSKQNAIKLAQYILASVNVC